MNSSGPWPRLAILGKVASGKGTQSRIIAKEYNLVHIGIGDILRNQLSHSNNLIQAMNSGQLASEKLVRNLVSQEIDKALTEESGFVLDGFPRHIDQVMYLEEILGSSGLTAIINIQISDDVSIERLKKRMVCGVCGNPGTRTDNATKELCSQCGAELIHRADDDIEVARKRLGTHEQLAQPVLDRYQAVGRLLQVDGSSSIDEIAVEIREYVAMHGGARPV